MKKEKIKNILKNTHPYIINSLIIIIILLLTLIISNTSPFGNNILGKSDAIVQFKPMLYDLIMGIKTNTLEGFSFNNGLGNPTIFNFLYYLASPFNLIALLFNNPDKMYLSTIVFKTAIASLTMTMYLKKKTNNFFITIIGTISYVFSNWYLAYYFYLPWLDIIMLFPLFQLGLEKLLTNKEPYTYIFSLALLIICNFYLAFPVCIYTLTYFIIYKFFYNKEKKLYYFNKITLSTIASILLTFFYLYALCNAYIKMGLSFSNEINTNYTITITSIISSLFYGNINLLTKFEGQTFPNIATNTFILINLIYYLLNTKISKKEKKLSLVIILLVIASITIKQFDFVLNLFHNVRGFTYRYSFIIVFLSIIPLIRNYQTFDNNLSKKKIYLILLLITGLLLLSQKSISTNIFILNIVSILTYFVLTIFYNKSKSYKVLLIAVIILQTIIACITNIPNDKVQKEEINTTYYNQNTKYRLNYAYQNDDNEYSNKNLYTNTDVTYLYTSMTYNKVVYLTDALGCYTADNTLISCSSKDSLTSMYLNVKNNYYLEKIFAVNKDILATSPHYGNVKLTQESLVESTTGVKDIFDKTTLNIQSDNNNNYFITDKEYYLIDQEISDGYTLNFPQTYQKFYIDNPDIKEINIYTINEDKLKEVHDNLKENQIKYTKYTNSHIKGTITINENQMIFTSIPYDKDWIVKIDGKEVEKVELLDALLGVECEPGTHTIELMYKPKYTIPIIISSATFIFLITKIFIDKRKKNEI